MLRNNLKYVSWKDYKAVTADLKRFTKPVEDQALAELERLGQQSKGQYPQIAKSWTTHWVNLGTLFDYPPEIRKAIYTTNAIESLNSVMLCAVAHTERCFPVTNRP